MDFNDLNEIIPSGDVLKDYRKIFFAMKKILVPSYQYPYNNDNEVQNFIKHQSLLINDGNILIDKIVQNNDNIVDGMQGIDENNFSYISLSQKAIEPKLGDIEINATISNFFMAHELSHIVYRKLVEKINSYITENELNFLFRPDYEINMIPQTQSKEMLCDIFGIIILWIASLIDEKENMFNTIFFLKKIFKNLTINSIQNSSSNEIKFLKNEFSDGSDTHPSCSKRLLTIKYLVNRLSLHPLNDSEENIFNLCCVGIDTLNIFNKLNSGNDNYKIHLDRRGYISYYPIGINNNWNTFSFQPAVVGGSKKNNNKNNKNNKNTKIKKTTKSKSKKTKSKKYHI